MRVERGGALDPDAGGGPGRRARWARLLACCLLPLAPGAASGQASDGGAADAASTAFSPSALARRKVAMGDEFLEAKDMRLALHAYLDAANLDAQSVQARLRLGALYARLGHLEQAIEQWEIAEALEPGNREAARGIAEARTSLQRRAAKAAEGGASPSPKIYKVTPEEPPKAATTPPSPPGARPAPAAKP